MNKMMPFFFGRFHVKSHVQRNLDLDTGCFFLDGSTVLPLAKFVASLCVLGLRMLRVVQAAYCEWRPRQDKACRININVMSASASYWMTSVTFHDSFRADPSVSGRPNAGPSDALKVCCKPSASLNIKPPRLFP